MKNAYSSWLRRGARRGLLLLGLAGLLPVAQAQVSFGSSVLYPTGGYNQGIVTADFNGDGRPDLATANSSTATVSVLLQSGTTAGTFLAAASYSSGSSFNPTLAVGDLNGDGRPDLATINQQSTPSTVGVLLNSATTPGTFAPIVTYGAGGSDGRGIAIADMNGDGRLDLVAATSTTVGILLNSATTPGTFGTVATYSGGGAVLDEVMVGDLNGDGRPDVVVGSRTATTVSVLLNSATTPGTLGTASLYTVGNSTYVRSVALGDLNNDGRLDIAASNYNDRTVSVLLNSAATPGTFLPKTDYANGSTQSPLGVTIGDLNGDGLADLVSSNYGDGSGNTVSVLVNSSTTPGTFPATPTVYATGGTGPNHTVIRDLNADGRLDLAVSNITSQNVGVLLNTTVFAAPTLTTINPTSGPVGTQVTITGTNLSSATGVSFNGTAATTFAVVNATTITATVPTGATTGNVTVTTGGGTSNGLAFMVGAPPTVTTTGVTSNSITSTSAQLGGLYTNSSGTTTFGVVYVAGTGTPTTSDGVLSSSATTPIASFGLTVTGLTPGTLYTYRAFATNSAGTSYGTNVTFTTLALTTVTSINRVGSSPTNAGSVSYTVTFAAPVTGLSTNNFVLVPTGSVSGASITSLTGSGTTYTVTVNTGTGDGTLRLNLVNAIGLSPGLSTTLPFVGQVYTIDKTAPVARFTSAPASPTNNSNVSFYFSSNDPGGDAVVNFQFYFDGVLRGNGTGLLGIGFPATDGQHTAQVVATDPAGNVGPAASYTFTIDTQKPAVTSLTSSASSPTSTSPIPFTVTFSEAVTGFTASSISVTNGTVTAGSVAGGGASYSFSVMPTASGTVTVGVPANGVTDLAGNGNTAATPYSIVYASAPAIVSFSPATGPVGTQVTITGANLSGATAVRFNGTAASSFVVNSATSITAIVAAGTTTGLVTVATPSGTATSSTNFVVRVAPITVADAYSTPAGMTLTGNVLANDIGTNPRAILITRTTNGTLVLNPNGSFTYVPNAGFTGTDSFTYYACDPDLPLLCGNPVTVTITVTRVAPITVADSYTTPAGTMLTGNVLTNDIGTNPRAILITRTTNGTLVLNPNGSFTYVPNAGFTGIDSFTYYACDPNLPLLCGNPVTVTITVTRVAPVTVADSYSTPQSVTLTGNVLTNDLGTNPRAILINRPTRGTLVLNPDGSFSYRPNAGFTGADSFTYYACDPNLPLLCGNPATVSITVVPTNTATRTAANAPTAAGSPAAAAKPAASATGGATIALELALTGYPNPFSDELQLSFALPLAQAYSLAVYDVQGRLVQQLASGQAEAGQPQELMVPTHTYAAGLYFVRLTTATGTQLLKLLKQ